MAIEERTANRQFTATCDDHRCETTWGAAPIAEPDFRQELVESGWTLVDGGRVLCPAHATDTNT